MPSLYAVKTLPSQEYFASGHRACPGCGEALAVRQVQKILGRNVIVASATGCMEIVSSPFPLSSWEVPWIHVAFENAAAVAAGIEKGLEILQRKGKIKKQKITVLAMAGDGGTADIGLQALSGALERRHNILFICYDNEAYMNTGVQRSSSTPFGASTTTSPAGTHQAGQLTPKKNMPAIAVAHGIPYVATASASYPLDLAAKVRKAAATRGPAYLHILSVCPSGWGIPGDATIKLGRLAVQSGVFPLYEVQNGKYKITVPVQELLPVQAYFQPQRRFRHLHPETIEQISQDIREKWQELKKRSDKTN